MSLVRDDRSLASAEVYQALQRSLRRRKGFGIVFVQCSPAQANRLIPQLQADLPQKNIAVLQLTEPIDNLCELVAERSDQQDLNILIIRGLEKSLESDIQPGYGGRGDYYNLNTVPRILNHLNQQRDGFRDRFPHLCFVFILPEFAIKYFIFRAPDFFDWSTGVFELPDTDLLGFKRLREQAEPSSISNAEQWNQSWERLRQYVDDWDTQLDTRYPSRLKIRGNLLRGDLERRRVEDLISLERCEKASAAYDQMLAIKPDLHQAWNNLGAALTELGRYEEAIAFYDKALEIKPGYSKALYSRAYALFHLGRYEEAIAAFDKAKAIKPNYHQAWNCRGCALDELGRYEEAIASYDKAIELRPNYDIAHYNKACCYALQGKVEKACEFLQRSIALDPKNREIAKMDSAFDEIREDERWRSLIEE